MAFKVGKNGSEQILFNARAVTEKSLRKHHIKYTASVVATREGETDKAGNNMEVYFSLPLATPVISSATSKGNGAVEVVWSAVKEA